MLQERSVGRILQPHAHGERAVVEVDCSLCCCCCLVVDLQSHAVSHLALVLHAYNLEVVELGEQVVAYRLVEGDADVIARIEHARLWRWRREQLRQGEVADDFHFFTGTGHFAAALDTYCYGTEDVGLVGKLAVVRHVEGEGQLAGACERLQSLQVLVTRQSVFVLGKLLQGAEVTVVNTLILQAYVAERAHAVVIS